MDMGNNGGQANHRVGGGWSGMGFECERWERSESVVDPACPFMATYVVLDIEVGPCLDQQLHNAVVAIQCPHERRAAILHHEWT